VLAKPTNVLAAINIKRSRDRAPDSCKLAKERQTGLYQTGSPPIRCINRLAVESLPLPKQGRTMDFHWIRVHWFELSALVLLALNLWFVVKVLSVLKAVQDGLLLLARWLDIARHDIEDQAGGKDASKD
jgi:hypothetical protein